MICTGSYKATESNKFKRCSISKDRGKDAGYDGDCFLKLAPKKTFWYTWRDNIGKVSDEDNNMYYIEEYYKQVLSKLDPEEVYNELNGSILLCYEDNDSFCHRHIVAEWIYIMLGEFVPEVKIENNELIELARPKYIKTYLEAVVRKIKKVDETQSLRALYLYEKSVKLDKKANMLNEDDEKYKDYVNEACYLRLEAAREESRYESIMNSQKYKTRRRKKNG